MHSDNHTNILTLRSVSKSYVTPAGEFPALREVSLDIQSGQCLAIVGKSGSGKTTLINLITGIDSPTRGEIHLNGSAIHQMNQEQLSRFRGENIGVVFQFFQLLPTLTVVENVMLPMEFCAKYAKTERQPRAIELLERLGIKDQAFKYPSELSGGQQQRAAIARALANDPAILVADEPTGNLDSKTSDEVLSLFAQLAREGKTILCVTHEKDFQSYFTGTISLVDGELVGAKG